MKTKFRWTAVPVAACLAGVAMAETSPYYVGGSVGYTHLSNVLGLTDGDPVPTGYSSRSDNVRSLSLIAGLDQPIGRQRLFGDLTLRRNQYAENDLLDNSSHALTAGIDWSTIEHISGSVTMKSSRELVRFGTFDPATPNRNLVSTRQGDATARIGGVSLLTIEGGVGYQSVDYSDPTYDGRDFSQSHAQIGFRYWSNGTNYVGLGLRDTNGRYPHFRQFGSSLESDHFDRRDIDLSAYWQLSGQTNVFGRISHTKLEYERQTTADFTGFTGFLKGSWQPTGKLRLSAELARDRAQDLRFLDFNTAEFFESARLATAFRLRAEYELTGKVALNANGGYTRRAVSSTQVITGAQTDGREIRRQYGLGTTWAPTRTSQIGCNLSREHRHSDVVETLNVSANTTSCYAQLTVQP